MTKSIAIIYALALIAASVVGCIYMEARNVFGFMLNRKYVYPVQKSVWGHFPYVERQLRQPKLKPKGGTFHEHSIVWTKKLTHEWLFNRASVFNAQWQKQYLSMLNICSIAPLPSDNAIRDRIINLECVTLHPPHAVAHKALELAMSLAEHAEMMHDQFIKKYGRISSDRRKATTIGLEHISCAQCYVVMFGSYPVGVLTYEYLLAKDETEHMLHSLDMLDADQRYEYFKQQVGV